MEGVAAAQRIWPIWKRIADVLARQAMMRLAEPLIVQPDLHLRHARPRQQPALDQ